MKTKILTILFTCLIMLTSCSNNENLNETDQNSIAEHTHELTVYGLTLGSKVDAVIDKLGYPQQKYTDIELSNGMKASRYVYGENELAIDSGYVHAIKTKDPEFHTKTGISINDPADSILSIYEKSEIFKAEHEIYVRLNNSYIIRFGLKDGDTLIEDIEYTTYDWFNNSSSITFEQIIDMSKKAGSVNTDNKSSEIPVRFEIDNFSFNLETGQIEGLGISASYQRNEMIKALNNSYDLSIQEVQDSRIVDFEDGFVAFDDFNMTQQITINYKGSLTIKDIKEKYGRPTHYFEEEGIPGDKSTLFYSYQYRYYLRDYRLSIESDEPDGTINIITMTKNRNL